MDGPGNPTNVASDPMLMKVQLRRDLRGSLQKSGGKSFYLLEDPLAGKFYRIGVSEWKFASLLNGRLTLREATALYAATCEPTLGASDLVSLAKWLLSSQLATVTGGPIDQTEVSAAKPAAKSWLSNPLFVRIPLFNPDRLISTLLPYLSFTLTRAAFLIWLVVCSFGLGAILFNWRPFSATFSTVLAPDNWLYLFLVWFCLKIVHELYHGLICKKYGGDVPRCGVMFIMFSPVAFVDVTSSWRFRSKWQRIYTSAGGMYCEFFIAAIAAVVWASTEPGFVNQLCHNIVISASLSTLLFNGNFLMRFDGYYIVTDLLEIQNLYTKGQQFLRHVVRHYLLGVPSQFSLDREPHPRLIQVYSFASLIWRIFFYFGILTVAATMFQGAGVVLAVVTGVAWFFRPGVTFLLYLIKGSPQEQPNRLRFAAIMAGVLASAGAVSAMPWPGGVSVPGVVDYSPIQVVWAPDKGGFVRKVLVKPGDIVEVGDTLLVLENKDLDLELAQKQAERVAVETQEGPAYPKSKKLAVLDKQIFDLQQRVSALKVQAPVSGVVIGRNLDSLIGRFVSKEALLSIGDESSKQVILSAPQRDELCLRSSVGQEVNYIRAKGRFDVIDGATVATVDPKAQTSVPHEALAAPNGGPLTVESGKDGHVALLKPRCTARVKLSAESTSKLLAGELVRVRLDASHLSTGKFIYLRFQEWLRWKADPREVSE
ncbi:MAG: biotin/lipoyl-binding protein [Planctomycetales bacterium]|nr:biotin/lipoyl-binding protein [Planctomycetales bacterium]